MFCLSFCAFRQYGKPEAGNTLDEFGTVFTSFEGEILSNDLSSTAGKRPEIKQRTIKRPKKNKMRMSV